MSRVIMKYTLRIFILSTLILSFQQNVIANENLAVTLSDIAKRVGGKENVGTQVNMAWSENEEVSKLLSFSDNKRIATIVLLLEFLEKNEKKVVKEITDDKNFTVFIFMRLKSYEYISTLITAKKSDIIIKNYFDNEISDLKMIIGGKQKYRNMYTQAHKMRYTKVTILSLSEENIVKETLLMLNKKANIAQVIANKTTLISLAEICAFDQEVCASL